MCLLFVCCLSAIIKSLTPHVDYPSSLAVAELVHCPLFPVRCSPWAPIYNVKTKREHIRTDLFTQHLPLESTQIPHGPNIIPPPIPLLAANHLRVQHLRHRLGHGFIEKLDPRLCKVGLAVFLLLLLGSCRVGVVA